MLAKFVAFWMVAWLLTHLLVAIAATFNGLDLNDPSDFKTAKEVANAFFSIETVLIWASYLWFFILYGERKTPTSLVSGM